jgi:hypothetical protein
MGLLRYITQGFGWHVGAHVAKETIKAVDRLPEERGLTKREAKRIAKAQRKAAERDLARRRAEKARADAAIEAQLRDLKKRAKS